MVRSKRLQIVLILIFFFGLIVSAQDKEETEVKDRKLREEILAVYKSKGEQGLSDFVKKNQDKITNKFIVDFAEAGVDERKEEWLKVCKILSKEKKDEKTIANVLYKIGEYFILVSNNKKAIYHLEQALPLYIKLNDLVGQGEIYQKKGDVYFLAGDSSKALEMYKKSMVFFKNTNNYYGQGTVYMGKGDIFFRIGENSKAFEMYDKALYFFKKAETPLGQGNVYMSKGDIYLRIGKHTKALEMFDNALFFFEKAGEPLGQGNVYWSKGNFYYYTGNSSKALEMYDKALYFFDKTEQPIGKGNVYLQKGGIYLYTGDNSKALEMYSIALQFFENAKEPLGQGNVHLKRGDIYMRTGDNSKAFEMYNKALPYFQKAGAPLGQGNVYLKKGNIYLRTGDTSKALGMYNKALFLFEKAGSLLGRGNVYASMGDAHFYTRDNSKALDMYDKALHFFKKAGQPIGQGNVYRSKGNVYFYIGDNAKALAMLEQALSFFKGVKDPRGQGDVYNSKGDIYFYNGDNSTSLEMHNKALSFYKKIGDIESEANALHDKAKALAKQGKKGEALELFEKGIANLEKVRTQTAFSEMKKNFLEKSYAQYEETVLFMLENKYYKKGYKYTESMRLRVFLDRIAEGMVRLDKGLTPDLKDKRDRLLAKLSLLSKEIHKIAGGNDEKESKELKEKYRKIEAQFEELLIKIRLENPLYASVRYPKPISVQELQKDVLKKGEILVRYFFSSDKIYVFLVSKKKFKLVPLKVTKEEIESAAERYLLAIKENKSNDMKKFGISLYKKLLKPLKKRLKKTREIIIIPDGKLAAIPFESLVIDKKESGQYVFLLEKYQIRYIQSASILSVLRKHYQRDRETQNFIGFGDPVYDYEKFKQETKKQAPLNAAPPASPTPAALPGVENEIKEIHRGKYDREGGQYTRLKGSGEEVKAIAELFKKKNQKAALYLRADATEENAKKTDMKAFDYIHFGCHGILGETFQSLVLSEDIPGTKEDGYFTLNEIMNCDYNAKLVVLSACETGSGKMERAEGVTGLTRAVMYAGTPAVVASLWKVDDNATKELMVNFYKNLLEKNLDKAEALRQAKLELINNKKYRSPIFWSAFVMYGE